MGGAFSTDKPSQHTLTAANVIRRFLDRHIIFDARKGGALRGCELTAGDDGLLDLDLFETDLPRGTLIRDIATRGALDLSLLLTGPPGTGKTALAAQLARALYRPLLVNRASDPLSRWVGAPRRR